MTPPTSTGEILRRATTEGQAVELLVAAGRSRADAEEVAAIAFGSSGGDVPAEADRRSWGTAQAVYQP